MQEPTPSGAPGAFHILLVEDNPGDARLTQELLRETNTITFETVHVVSLDAALKALDQRDFDIVLLDLSLGDASGIDIVKRMREHCPTVPLIVLSGLEDETTAMLALQEGAQDYLVKGQGDGHLIGRAIRYAVERKRVESQLVEAKNSAESASRAKSEFLANMSHELRTPLNAIIGFSEILSGEHLGPLSNIRYLEYASDIHSSGQHLLSIINDVLDMSKIEAGKLQIHEEEIALAPLLSSSLRMVRERARKQRVELVCKMVGSGHSILADERAIRQCLLNLLSNAVKFSPQGGRITVDVAVDPAGRTVLTITDEGIGMSEEEQERALQPFGQAHSATTRTYGGTGLGLPITQGLIEAHGGVMTITSRPGEGTRVAIVLPAERTRSASRAKVALRA